MSRYIDADEFGRCLRNYRPYVDSGRFNAIQTEVNQLLDCIEYEVEDAPSIDICFCRECKRCSKDRIKWSVKDEDGNWIDTKCNLCRRTKLEVNLDDFCSYGEREGE